MAAKITSMQVFCDAKDSAANLLQITCIGFVHGMLRIDNRMRAGRIAHDGTW